MKIIILGTGDAAQIPVYGCQCIACLDAKTDLARQRKPCSALIEHEGQRWLIDSGFTDLTKRFEPEDLTGIIQTHYHADHIQGLLHLRWGVGKSIPVYGPNDPQGFADLYKHPGILDFQPPFTAFLPYHLTTSLTITAIPLIHSRPTYGYLFAQSGFKIAYLTDTCSLSEESIVTLQKTTLDLFIIECSLPPQLTTPKNHNDLTMVINIIKQLSCKKVILTHIGHQFACWLQHHSLPNYIEVASDGDVFGF